MKRQEARGAVTALEARLGELAEPPAGAVDRIVDAALRAPSAGAGRARARLQRLAVACCVVALSVAGLALLSGASQRDGPRATGGATGAAGPIDSSGSTVLIAAGEVFAARAADGSWIVAQSSRRRAEQVLGEEEGGASLMLVARHDVAGRKTRKSAF